MHKPKYAYLFAGSISVATVFSVNALTLSPPNPLICDLDVQVQQNGALPNISVLTINVANINEPHLIDNLPYAVYVDTATAIAPKMVTELH